MDLENFHLILDFAIDKEEEAYRFYTDLTLVTKKPEMKAIFQEFAQEELGHKKKLLNVKAGKSLNLLSQAVLDLKIADYTVDVPYSPNMDYQEALILAMKKEKAAFTLYSDLAAIAVDEELVALLKSLAQEEAKHKLRFELEYDREILKEN